MIVLLDKACEEEKPEFTSVNEDFDDEHNAV